MLLTGLQPGEMFSYNLLDGSGAVLRRNLNFTMPPAIGDPIRFVLVGMSTQC